MQQNVKWPILKYNFCGHFLIHGLNYHYPRTTKPQIPCISIGFLMNFEFQYQKKDRSPLSKSTFPYFPFVIIALGITIISMIYVPT